MTPRPDVRQAMRAAGIDNGNVDRIASGVQPSSVDDMLRQKEADRLSVYHKSLRPHISTRRYDPTNETIYRRDIPQDAYERIMQDAYDESLDAYRRTYGITNDGKGGYEGPIKFDGAMGDVLEEAKGRELSEDERRQVKDYYENEYDQQELDKKHAKELQRYSGYLGYTSLAASGIPIVGQPLSMGLGSMSVLAGAGSKYYENGRKLGWEDAPGIATDAVLEASPYFKFAKALGTANKVGSKAARAGGGGARTVHVNFRRPGEVLNFADDTHNIHSSLR